MIRPSTPARPRFHDGVSCPLSRHGRDKSVPPPKPPESPVPSLQTFIPTALLALLIFYFGFHALTGERGLLLSRQRQATLEEKQTELKRLRAERADLEARARFLRDDSLSADLLEERAHVLLGFADPRDYVIRVTPDHG